MKNRAGFTLFETLIVMAIVSLMLLLVPRSSYSLNERFEERLFFDQLTQSIKFCQEQAIMTRLSTRVLFEPGRQCVYFQKGAESAYEVIMVPEFLTLHNLMSISFNRYGHVGEFGTVRFTNSAGRRFSIVFQLGNGQFEIR